MRNASNRNADRKGAKRAGIRVGAMVIGAALTLLPSVTAAGSGPKAPEANTLVRKMLTVYKKANSLQADFEAQVLRLGGSEYIQSGNMRYQRPDRVALYTTDPITGTFQAWSDGRTIVVYSGKTNAYTKRTALPGLGATIDGIEKTSEEVLQVRSTQLFSPLSFILAKDMPREAHTFTYLRQETVGGRKTYCVSAKMDVEFIKIILENRNVIPLQRDVKLWIDARTSQLVRSASTLVWKTPLNGSGGGKTVYSRPDGFSAVETYSSVIFDAPIKDDVFRFTPPFGAKQLFQERR